MGRIYVLVEGHGEVEAVASLLWKLNRAFGPWPEGGPPTWRAPRRWPNLHKKCKVRRGGLGKALDFARSRPDADGLLVLRDEDDRCPAELAPQVADWIREKQFPFPVAYVLLKPEFEVLFLPCLDRLGLPPWDGADWESRRGLKEWIRKHSPIGYRPTEHQDHFTKRLDLQVVLNAGLPSMGSLLRGARFLAEHRGEAGAVYPRPVSASPG